MLKDQPRTIVRLPDKRSTKRFELHISPEARDKMEKICHTTGVPYSRYVNDLIIKRKTEPFPCIELAPLVRLSELVGFALESLGDKDEATRQTLLDARKVIAEALFAHNDEFEAGMAKRGEGAATAWRG